MVLLFTRSCRDSAGKFNFFGAKHVQVTAIVANSMLLPYFVFSRSEDDSGPLAATLYQILNGLSVPPVEYYEWNIVFSFYNITFANLCYKIIIRGISSGVNATNA